ncbi:hypothetical protein CRG98_046800 [Punica granatum]|uniref:Uncharacterized protein n=1 Tax=Punica granatum TaxID=22663 RepID=A0A2I0HM42_PUNGR|nr:hypothetical protein CRG98_046800 [Punica granatum]
MELLLSTSSLVRLPSLSPHHNFPSLHHTSRPAGSTLYSTHPRFKRSRGLRSTELFGHGSSLKPDVNGHSRRNSVKTGDSNLNSGLQER